MITEEHLEELRVAKERLERIPFRIQVANALGTPIEWGVGRLPGPARQVLGRATQGALDASVRWAVASLGSSDSGGARPGLHRAAAVASGAVGGAFGLAAVVPELAFSTTVILRSVAAIARENGEDLRDPETRLQCLSVLSFGGPSRADDAAETSYYATRAALARTLRDAAGHLAARQAGRELAGSAPVLVRFVQLLARRFGIVVEEKLLAQSLPLVGAAGGALVNGVFIDHFQTVGRGHFAVRRLERIYGMEEVRAAYAALEP